jgi:Fe2+ or Zn2+ uptake regulation protein
MSKNMSVELIEALRNAGLEVAPSRLKVELTVDQAAAKIMELEEILKVAKETKDLKLARKIRRQMRNLGFSRSAWLKAQAE